VAQADPNPRPNEQTWLSYQSTAWIVFRFKG